MLNVGIIGTGFGAKVQIPGFQKIKGIKINGIWGRNFSEAKYWQDKYNIPNIYRDWIDLVKSNQIDVVSIATPPFLHKSIILAAAKNKKTIICEKPFTINYAEALHALRATDKAGVSGAVDFEFRYIAHFQKLKELLQKKTIGEIRYCQINWLTGGRAKKNLPLNWSDYKKNGGGVLLNYGSHVIDYLLWFFGDIKKVNARLSRINEKESKKKCNAEDCCELMLETKNGIVITAVISNAVYGGSGHNIKIFGSEGSLQLVNEDVFDAVKGFELLKISPNDERETVMKKKQILDEDGRIDAFSKLANDFLIAKTKKNAPSFSDGVRTHQVIQALEKSQKIRGWVTL